MNVLDAIQTRRSVRGGQAGAPAQRWLGKAAMALPLLAALAAFAILLAVGCTGPSAAIGDRSPQGATLAAGEHRAILAGAAAHAPHDPLDPARRQPVIRYPVLRFALRRRRPRGGGIMLSVLAGVSNAWAVLIDILHRTGAA